MKNSKKRTREISGLSMLSPRRGCFVDSERAAPWSNCRWNRVRAQRPGGRGGSSGLGQGLRGAVRERDAPRGWWKRGPRLKHRSGSKRRATPARERGQAWLGYVEFRGEG